MLFAKIRKCLSAFTFFMLHNIIGGLCTSFFVSHYSGIIRQGRKVRNASSKKKAVFSDDQSVGGQAVIEGVMIRSPYRIATAIRKANKEILIRSDPYIALSKRLKLLNIPVLRGALSFFEMLFIGIKTLNFSADIALEDAERTGKGSDWQRTGGEKVKDGLILAGVLAFAFALALGIFFAFPLFLTEVIGLSKNALFFNVVAGIIRSCFFLIYLYAISQWKEIRRILEYHGAEHKGVHTFESGKKLTIENARRYSTHHPRCGTSFLLIVVILAILFFAATDTVVGFIIGHSPTLLQRFITHFSLLPLLGGIAYELLKLSGKKRDNKYVRWLAKPGLWLQNMTTREPDDAQMEVAIVALKSALAKG